MTARRVPCWGCRLRSRAQGAGETNKSWIGYTWTGPASARIMRGAARTGLSVVRTSGGGCVDRVLAHPFHDRGEAAARGRGGRRPAAVHIRGSNGHRTLQAQHLLAPVEGRVHLHAKGESVGRPEANGADTSFDRLRIRTHDLKKKECSLYMSTGTPIHGSSTPYCNSQVG